jgi:hypothetical protein
VRYFKRQIPQPKKETRIKPYFYLFDAYQFAQIDMLEATPLIKN